MYQHIDQTMEEVQQEIAGLQALLTGLQRYKAARFGNPVPAKLEEAVNKMPEPSAVKRPAARATKGKQKKASAQGSLVGEETQRVAQIVAGIPTPITAQIIADAAKVPRKYGSNFITQSLKRGWLKRVGPGKYERTRNFPDGAKAARVPATPVKAAASSLMTITPSERTSAIEEKLKQACQDRDWARERGNETLEKILNDKIQKLQVQLEARTNFVS